MIASNEIHVLHDQGVSFARCMEEVHELLREKIRPHWLELGVYDIAGITGELFGVVQDVKFPGQMLISTGYNLVVDTGDIYYAERGGNAKTPTAPTNFTVANLTYDGILELGTAGTAAKGDTRTAITVIASTQKAADSGYPTLADGDADNPGTTGVDIITYRTSYTAADFNNGAITNAIITNPSPAAGEALLCHGTVASFAKGADDTLKFFWNHQMNGV